MRRSAIVAVALALLVTGLASSARAQENQPPNAVIRSNPVAGADGAISGASPLTVTFNACRSTDPDPGDVLKFLFDLDGDGSLETFGECRQTVTYHAVHMAGATVTVCVWDRVPAEGHQICKRFQMFEVPEQRTPTPAPAETPAFLHGVAIELEYLGSAAVASAPILSTSELYRFASDGTSTLVGSTRWHRVRGLDLGPDGRLYAIAGSPAGGTATEVVATFAFGYLLELAPATGVGSEVGLTGTGSVDDLAFRSNGVLYGIRNGCDLWKINAATGTATYLTELDDYGMTGIAFVGDVLYAANSRTLYRFGGWVGDTPANSPSSSVALVYPPGFDDSGLLTGLDLGPDGALYASLWREGAAESFDSVRALNGSTTMNLLRIDPSTGAVTVVKELPDGVLSLTWSR